MAHSPLLDKIKQKKPVKPRIPQEERDTIGFDEDSRESKITPEQYELQLEPTHRFKQRFEDSAELQTEDFTRFNDRTTAERDLLYQKVEHAQEDESKSEARDRIQEKAVWTIEQFFHDASLVERKLSDITRSIRNVIDLPFYRKKELLEKVKSEIEQLGMNVGVMITYFDLALANVENFRKVYPDDFQDLMMAMLEPYYTKTQRNKDGLTVGNDLMAVIREDVNQFKQTQSELTDLISVVTHYLDQIDETSEDEDNKTVEAQEAEQEVVEKDSLGAVTHELKQAMLEDDELPTAA